MFLVIALCRAQWASLVMLGLLACIFALSASGAQAKVTRVLMVTGDWKAQAWYQDVWMKGGGKKLYRGRYITQKVNEAAPGQFDFTDVTNYTGQEYLDADYLSQFNVLLLGDIVGWSLNPRFEAAIQHYVKNGGGVIYCASLKWHCTMPKGTPFADVLPAEFPFSNYTDDWQSMDAGTPDSNFKPIPVATDHPTIKGLDWANVPTLLRSFKIVPKPGSTVLLKGPSGAPTVVAWSYGQGRAIMTSSIHANDELSEAFGNNWKDFGKFYAQVFAWLGENSKNVPATLKPVTAEVNISVDYTGKPANKITAAVFSLHGAQNCPGFSPLQGLALDNFKALNPEGGLARFHANCEPERGKFDFKNVDQELSEIKRLGLEPIALFAAYAYGEPKWLWADGSNWSKPSDKAVADIVEEVCTFLNHTNGKKGTADYRPNVKYIEICNEPGINAKTIDGYVKMFKAVAQRVHRDYPGVKVGGLGGYEIPYVKMFIDKCGSDVDWISRHPYGWTGEMLFQLEDDFQAYAREKGHHQIQYIVTECDFWIQGRQKFDYLMKRNFEAVKRDTLVGTLHYRFGMYNEPTYLFGILWDKWGQNQGAGPANTPMHDAYDAFWIFRDFRGQRVPVTKSLPAKGTAEGLLNHVLADGTRDGDRLNAVLYYDWAYDGTGYKDYAKGLNYSKVSVKVKLTLPPVAKERTLTISRATGEGFEILKKDIKVPAGQKEYTGTIEVAPLTAISISLL